MTNSDKEEFAKLFYGIGELYDKPVSKNILQLYFNALIEFYIDEVIHAAGKHALDVKHGSFFPKPADIARHIESKALKAESRAEIAWAQIINAISRTGSYGSLNIDDKQAMAAVKALGSWKDLCMTDTDKLTWKKKEFMSIYETYENTPIELLPRSLPGMIELDEYRNKEKSKQISNESQILNRLKSMPEYKGDKK